MDKSRKLSSGDTVAEARKQKGWSLRKLAREIGKTAPLLSEWERRVSIPSDRVGRAVAEKLGVDFEKLRSRMEMERFVRKRDKLEADHGMLTSKGDPDARVDTVYEIKEKRRRNEYTQVAGVVRVPVLSEIPAGGRVEISVDLLEQVEEFEYVAADMISDLRNVFALTISGSSMSHRKVEDGDRIVVDAGQEPGDGDLAVVKINDNEGILREVHFEGNIAILQSGSERPQVVNRSELVFVGKVIKIMKTP